MLGWKFAKFEPNLYVYVIKKGRVIKEGQGLSFRFYMPNTSIISIPMETKNVPFIFEESSSDYQTITIQGDLIYKISDSKKIRDQVNFSIDAKSLLYLSEDPVKLEQRIINMVKTLAKSEVSLLNLRDAIKSVEKITTA
ncbi:MAG: SPFH domain-containing protein, partial [Spirochaetales bacterium]